MTATRNDLLAHQAAVIEAHDRYARAKRRLDEIDAAHMNAHTELTSALAELTALATRAPK